MADDEYESEDDTPWSHAEIKLASDDAITDQELIDFLATQPQITRVYEDVPTP